MIWIGACSLLTLRWFYVVESSKRRKSVRNKKAFYSLLQYIQVFQSHRWPKCLPHFEHFVTPPNGKLCTRARVFVSLISYLNSVLHLRSNACWNDMPCLLAIYQYFENVLRHRNTYVFSYPKSTMGSVWPQEVGTTIIHIITQLERHGLPYEALVIDPHGATFGKKHSPSEN